ncbi:hypothetical protein PROFUN_02951 [Planoprotostelium fungivorum]|uniref:Peptidase S53 domain-containing protein n=1 Tax=Planoprotostelium fungivorum TaxID=1890364 RepID=A0A2P6NX50_9EUKA|nr:hypothetical protein PROFUN_02951 [Planoprotostelium fungivorum]
MDVKLLGIVFLLLSLGCAEKRKTLSDRQGLPKGWRQGVEADASHPFTFTVHLKHQNLDVLDDIFWKVSDPQHTDYGKFLSSDQVDSLIRPDATSFDSVIAWLNENNVTSQSFKIGNAYVRVNTNTATASRMFQTRLTWYHSSKRSTVRSTEETSLPAHLSSHVELVTGLNEFHPPARITSHRRKRSSGSSSPYTAPYSAYASTPSALRTTYNHTSGTNSSTTQGVMGFQDVYEPTALSAFEKANGLPTISPINVPSLTCPSTCDKTESNLDVQYITGVGSGIQTYFISSEDKNNDEFILEGLEVNLPNAPVTPQILSISYGIGETVICDGAFQLCGTTTATATASYRSRSDTLFQKLGAQGVTILVASGDNGAQGDSGVGLCPANTTVYCLAGGCTYTSTLCPTVEVKSSNYGNYIWPTIGKNDPLSSVQNLYTTFASDNSACNVAIDQDTDGNYHLYSECACSQLVYNAYNIGNGYGSATFAQYKVATADRSQYFSNGWPGTSPYVTSVGATLVYADNTETTCSSIGGSGISSEGGFSTVYTQPSYQSTVVNNYLNNHAPTNNGLYTKTGRGYPDISFSGHNYPIYTGCTSTSTSSCTQTSVDGTSASTPILGGMIALINDQLITAGKSTVGFLNPILYQAYSQNVSIFRDITTGDNKCSEAYCCQYGFPAAPGWDPATGLGSFDHAQFSAYVMAQKVGSSSTSPPSSTANPSTSAHSSASSESRSSQVNTVYNGTSFYPTASGSSTGGTSSSASTLSQSMGTLAVVIVTISMMLSLA